uniref:Uncharacterized protein n=1 Tax=Romanomermis culicivorax TaxID=13658 RepID=A0A915KL52_ROMCU
MKKTKKTIKRRKMTKYWNDGKEDDDLRQLRMIIRTMGIAGNVRSSARYLRNVHSPLSCALMSDQSLSCALMSDYLYLPSSFHPLGPLPAEQEAHGLLNPPHTLPADEPYNVDVSNDTLDQQFRDNSPLPKSVKLEILR